MVKPLARSFYITVQRFTFSKRPFKFGVSLIPMMLGKPQMLLSVDAMAEFPQHRSTEGIHLVWNYLEIAMRLSHVVKW